MNASQMKMFPISIKASSHSNVGSLRDKPFQLPIYHLLGLWMPRCIARYTPSERYADTDESIKGCRGRASIIMLIFHYILDMTINQIPGSWLNNESVLLHFIDVYPAASLRKPTIHCLR